MNDLQKSLISKILTASNKIERRSRRGLGNWVILGNPFKSWSSRIRKNKIKNIFDEEIQS
jgi:hypothetical protein